MTFIAARGTALLKLSLLYCISFYGWIREREGWSESCILIGYPSGQDWPFLPSRDLPRIPVLVLLYLVSKGFLNVFLTSLVISFPFPNFSCYCFPCSFEEFWTGLLSYSDGISEVCLAYFSLLSFEGIYKQEGISSVDTSHPCGGGWWDTYFQTVLLRVERRRWTGRTRKGVQAGPLRWVYSTPVYVIYLHGRYRIYLIRTKNESKHTKRSKTKTKATVLV